MKNHGSNSAKRDLKQVCRLAQRGIVRNAALLKRIYDRTETQRKKIKQRFGIQDTAADLIREARSRE